jgi:hypothetical protein
LLDFEGSFFRTWGVSDYSDFIYELYKLVEQNHAFNYRSRANNKPKKDNYLSKAFFLEIDEGLVLGITEKCSHGAGDSLGLERGLILFVENKPAIGEGVGFGVPAIEYSDKILFSSSATTIIRNDTLIRSYSIDAVQRKTWGRFTVDVGLYRVVQNRLAKVYRTDRRFRRVLTQIMFVQSLLGIRPTYEKVNSRGYVDVSYNLVGKKVIITVNCSRLVHRDFRRLLVFNEQSADFNIYQDDFGILTDEDIGVWEEVKSRNASLRSRNLNVGFSVENLPGTRLYRGRELFRPRLDWAGFCYYIPSETERFTYTVQIT